MRSRRTNRQHLKINSKGLFHLKSENTTVWHGAPVLKQEWSSNVFCALCCNISKFSARSTLVSTSNTELIFKILLFVYKALFLPPVISLIPMVPYSDPGSPLPHLIFSLTIIFHKSNLKGSPFNSCTYFSPILSNDRVKEYHCFYCIYVLFLFKWSSVSFFSEPFFSTALRSHACVAFLCIGCKALLFFNVLY